MLKGMEVMAAYSFMALVPIVNPVGTAPIFLAMISGATSRQHRQLAWRVSLYAFILLVVSTLLGGMIIRFLGIQIAHVEIAGGLIVFHTAWQMLNGTQEPAAVDPAGTTKSVEELAFFPLTLPITAGPGCIAVAIAIGSRVGHGPLPGVLESYLGAVLGVLGVSVAVWFCFRFASALFSKLGPTGTTVFTKMSAFVLLAIGVEIFWSGLAQLIRAL